MDDKKIERVRDIYYPFEKLYAEARENRNKARHDSDMLAYSYYDGECAVYHEMIFALKSIFRILGIHDEVFKTR